MANKKTVQAAPSRVVKGDRVKVIRGNFRDQEGTVLRILRAKNKVVVEGVNMRKPRDPSPRESARFHCQNCRQHSLLPAREYQASLRSGGGAVRESRLHTRIRWTTLILPSRRSPGTGWPGNAATAHQYESIDRNAG